MNRSTLALALALAFAPCVPVRAQVEQPAASANAPFGDPVVRADAELRSDKAQSWTEGPASFLLLEGDVTIEVGTYGFRAERAVVRTETERLPGKTIRHLSMYLDDARPIRGRGRVAAEAKRLLVTASTTGEVVLQTHLLTPVDAAPNDELVQAADQRIDAYLLALMGPARAVPGGDPLIDPTTLEQRLARRGQLQEQQSEQRTENIQAAIEAGPKPDTAPREPGTGTARLAESRGILIPDFKRFTTDPANHALILMGDVRLAYQDFEHDRAIILSCQNAVVFFHEDVDLGTVADGEQVNIDLSQVTGFYLEDNVVITDGNYTIRAPRVFYNPTMEKALVLDAVFYTWDDRREVPIYLRAQKLRQLSAESWAAEQALVTTSEFAEPHFAIASNRIGFDLTDDPEGRKIPRVETESIVPKWGDLPVGWFPGMKGTAADIPLRRVQAGYDSQNGPQLQTRWDMFSLLGMENPEDVDMSADIDYLGDHGAGVGSELDYDKSNLFGSATAYLLPHDGGEDEFGGREVEHDGDTRGFLHWQHRQYLQDHWELSLETAYVSDPTFLEEFFRDEAETSKPYETSVYVKRQEDDEAFTFLAQYDLLDFTAQTPVLQSPGYTVEKLPEVGYYRVGTSLLGDRLTYYTENRAGRMRIRGGEDDPEDRGFSNFESMLNFGIPRTTDFEDALEMAGIPDDSVTRLDSRHELQAPMKIAFLDVVPYVAGRVTLYDEDFEEYAGEDENARLWGSSGLRLHTTFSRNYDGVESKLLDLHRLRHIVEPNADLHLSGADIDPEDIPVYDPSVEGIREGSSGRFGVRNTWQTQRGGEGRWRSVDWIVLNTDVIVRSDDTDIETEPARYFSYRPEYGTGGDHFYSDLAWMVSDMFALRGDITQSLESGDTSQWHVGAVVTHSPDLSTFIEYAELDPLGSRLLSAGFTYKLTSKYRVGVNQRWDLERSASQRTEFTLERKLPRWTLMVIASVDNIDHDQSIGIVLIPDGIRTSRLLGPWGR